jgi:hypothetical protein
MLGARVWRKVAPLRPDERVRVVPDAAGPDAGAPQKPAIVELPMAMQREIR